MNCAAIKPYRTKVTNHSLQPVSVERAKEQLFLYDDDSDAIISRYIQSATALLEEWACYYLMPADIVAYFTYCDLCRPTFTLNARPYNSLVSVEVLQEGIYVALTDEQFSVVEKDWEALVKICETVAVDSECGDVDPVRISYKVGNWAELAITDITATGDTALLTADDPHGLFDNDQVIISGTGESDLDGTYSVTVTSSTQFTYTYLGTPDLSVATGLLVIPIIPNQLEQAILEMVANMYTNRGDCSDSCGPVPCAVQTKASQFKRRIIRTTRTKDVCSCQ